MNSIGKIYSFLIISILLSLTSSAQTNWLNGFGGKGNDEALSNTVLNNGNIITGGYFSLGANFENTYKVSRGSGDAFVSCQDANGRLLWVSTGGGIHSDRVYSVSSNDSDYIFITGTYSGDVSFGSYNISGVDSSQNIFVAKLDSAGNYIWVKSFGGDDNDLAYDIAADNAGNVVITGQFKGSSQFGSQTLVSKNDPVSNFPSYDIFILKLDWNGDMLWVKQGEASYDDKGSSVAIDSIDNIYLSGQFSDSIRFDVSHNYVVFNAGFILKLDSSGNEKWFKPYFASLLNPRSICNFKNDIIVSGDYSGNFNYDGQSVFSLTGSENYNYFIFSIDSNGVFKRSSGSGSEHPLNLSAVAASDDSIFITGNFRCVMTDFSSEFGKGIFNSVGFRDVFVAGYNSLLEKSWERQIGGPGDDYSSSIALQNNNAIISGSFQTNFNAPDGGSFLQNSATVDLSGTGPGQNLPYCNDPRYNRYKSIYASGFKDILSVKPIDLNRLPYDYFDRLLGNCIRDTLIPYINQNEDSIVACDSTLLKATLKTGLDGTIGPAYDYTWSDGSKADTLMIYQSGWYSLQIKTADECRTYNDSVYVQIYNTPAVPLVYATKGRMDEAIPVYCCYQKLLIQEIDTAFLYCTNVPQGYEVEWATPYGTVFNDSVLVNGSGCYVCFIKVPGGACSSSSCISVSEFYLANCFPTDFVPEIIFKDTTFQVSDTVTICEDEYFTMQLVDSTSWLAGLDPVIIAMVNWTISGGFEFDFAQSAPKTFLSHVQTFKPYRPPQSGNCTVTATIQNPLTGVPLYVVSRNFYLQCNLLPETIADIYGPSSICPGDTVSIVVKPSENCNFTGPGIIYINSAHDSIRVVADGYYSAEFTETDSVTGCSDNFTKTLYLPYTASPTITMNPVNGIICPGDSVLLTAANGNNYEWFGPLNTVIDSSQSIYVSVAGAYHYSLTDTGGCSLISEFAEVEEYSTPYLTADPSAVLCKGDSITINIQSNNLNGIVWNSPLSGSSPIQTINTPGIYSCSVSSCGITTSLTIPVTVSAVAAVINPDSITICPGDTLTLRANTGMDSYLWFPSGASGMNFTTYNAGVYILETQDLYGCIARDTIEVDTFPRPAEPNVNGDLICSGNIASLSASAAGPLLWYDKLTGGNLIFSGTAFTTPVLTNSTNYYVATTDGRCYSKRNKAEVIINPVSQNPVISGDSIYCDNDTIRLASASFSSAQYHWWNSNGVISTHAQMMVPAASQINSGYYYIQISDSQCTGPIDSIYINVRPAISVSIVANGSITLCSGDSVLLSANEPYSYYNWIPDFQHDSVIYIDHPGIYSLAVTDSFGCQGISNSITITKLPVIPSPVIFGPQTICSRDTLKLYVNNLAGAIYQWENYSGTVIGTDTLLLLLPNTFSGGTYKVIGTSVNGCRFENTFQLNINPSPSYSFHGKTKLCTGEDLSMEIVSSNSYASWSGPDSFLSTSNTVLIPHIDSTKTGYYYYTIYNSWCSVKDSVLIKLEPLQFVNLGNDTTVCNDKFFLTVDKSFNSISWNNNPAGSFSVLVDTAGLWIATVGYGNGCFTTDSIYVNLIDCDYLIPNVFSPNNDGVNDNFAAYFPSAQKIYTRIFDRYGLQVFEGKELNSGWNGRNRNNKTYPAGTYFYEISVIDHNGKSMIFKGDLTLVY